MKIAVIMFILASAGMFAVGVYDNNVIALIFSMVYALIAGDCALSVWPFPPPGFKHPKRGERIPFNPDNHEDAPL